MGQMIKFEHGMLVLNSLMTKEDVAAINEFADYVRNQENGRVAKLLEEQQVRLISNGFWTEGVAMGLAVQVTKGEV